LGINIIEQVLTLGAEYKAAGKLPLFDRLKNYSPRNPASLAAKIAAEMRMTETREQRFTACAIAIAMLHEEIAHTVAVPDDVDDELRHFIAYANVT